MGIQDEEQAESNDTEVLRIAYVENRVGGKAAKHLRPRLRASAVNPYTASEEMLIHLPRREQGS